MIPVIATVIFALTTDLRAVQTTKAAEPSGTHPVFVDVPKSSSGLTLYNDRGEVVAVRKKI